MSYDPIETVAAFLRSRDLNVSAAQTGHATHSRRLVISLVGGGVAVRNRLNRWRFDIDAYGPTKREALHLALDAYRAIVGDMPGWTDGTVIVSDVDEDIAPQDISDPVSREQRFVFSVSIYMYLRG